MQDTVSWYWRRWVLSSARCSMAESFKEIFAVGEKRNTLGRAQEVVDIVLSDRSHLDELYNAIFDDSPWIRMRAIDSLEKVCRVHPDWLEPYTDRLLTAVASIEQPSVQWHLAELFREINLSPNQRERAIAHLKQNIKDTSVDWIVAANTMTTLTIFVKNGYIVKEEVLPLLNTQQKHHSKAVVKRAVKLFDEITEG